MVSLFAIFEYMFGKNLIFKCIADSPYFLKFLVADNSHFTIRRPISTQFNPVVLGSYLLGCLPFCLLFIREKSNRLRVLGIVLVLLNIIVIILVRSRGVF